MDNELNEINPLERDEWQDVAMPPKRRLFQPIYQWVRRIASLETVRHIIQALRRFAHVRGEEGGVAEDSIFEIHGHLSLELRNEDDSLAGQWEYDNLVLTATTVTLAQFFTGLTTVYGAAYMEFGAGNVSWDTGTIPAPSLSDTALVSATIRKATSGNTYLDTLGNETGTPTNRPRMKATILSGDPASTYREVALFSSNSSTLGAGVMLTELRFQGIAKAAGQSLSANYDLTIVLGATGS